MFQSGMVSDIQSHIFMICSTGRSATHGDVIIVRVSDRERLGFSRLLDVMFVVPVKVPF